MLKMRSGVGSGYRVIVGLPNGAVVHIQKCEASGAVQCCRVALEEARSLVGWASTSYLREVSRRESPAGGGAFCEQFRSKLVFFLFSHASPFFTAVPVATTISMVDPADIS